MRLIELEINNVRGIRHLVIKPDQGNVVIWGSNGSGKSAVVDAIDFLLTGRMSRLTGKGTGDIKLDVHGVHIDCNPGEASVRAVIAIHNYKSPIEIKRCMDTSGVLQCDNLKDKRYLAPLLSVALRGQHVLTRREILKYITAEPSDRAQGIQSILDLKDIEDIRKAFVKVEHECEKAHDAIRLALTLAAGEIIAITGEKTYTVAGTLEYINTIRKVLKAPAITDLESTKVKSDVIPPTLLPIEQAINTIQLKLDIDTINAFLSDDNIGKLEKVDADLRGYVQSIKDSPQLLKSLKRLNIVNLGLELLEEDGVCPLCDTKWPPGQLRQHLEKHVLEAQMAGKYQASISALSGPQSISLSNIIAKVNNLIAVIEVIGLTKEKESLQLWVKGIEEIIKSLVNPVGNYDTKKMTQAKFRQTLKIPECQVMLDRILQLAESRFPKATPEMDAWDALTKLETRLNSLENTKKQLLQKALVNKRASELSENFLLARDAVLQGLYDSVRDRFVGLYLQIHGEDEAGFKAQIKPEKAGIDFKVDFYGRGEHPPHAMHSEGHQDSMGLCLYLALAEKLTKGIIDLIILDDVVMSVDADHRRNICGILSTSFPNNQFLITTHDRTWANQLRITKVVNSKGVVHFYNWHVATGPQVDSDADVWGRITQDLQKGDVLSAAGKLRQNSEQYFAMVCDALQAPVIFKLNGTYDLGNVLSGAHGQYNRLLSKAKMVAQSWGREEEAQKLQEFENIAQTIYLRTSAEQWSINPAIHYTNWENLSKADFQPVVDAFRDFYGVFTCAKCGGLLHVVSTGLKQKGVICDCPQVNWNLSPKPKTK
ncbi:AAA family ATPase [Chloroflexota bacterium]